MKKNGKSLSLTIRQLFKCLVKYFTKYTFPLFSWLFSCLTVPGVRPISSLLFQNMTLSSPLHLTPKILACQCFPQWIRREINTIWVWWQCFCIHKDNCNFKYSLPCFSYKPSLTCQGTCSDYWLGHVHPHQASACHVIISLFNTLPMIHSYLTTAYLTCALLSVCHLDLRQKNIGRLPDLGRKEPKLGWG